MVIVFVPCSWGCGTLSKWWENQLMVDWWFGAGWFGIRIGIPISNNPFHKGILGIQTTGPQDHQLTTQWKNMKWIIIMNHHESSIIPKFRGKHFRASLGNTTQTTFYMDIAIFKSLKKKHPRPIVLTFHSKIPCPMFKNLWTWNVRRIEKYLSKKDVDKHQPVGGFNPVKKYVVELDHFPKNRGENKKYLKPPPCQ